jgi:hypothetical protein
MENPILWPSLSPACAEALRIMLANGECHMHPA